MRRINLLFAAALVAAAPAFAQSGNPITSGTKALFNSAKNDIVKSAEEMPEENYSFKPTSGVRSFGQIVAHVADAQYEFCGPILNDGTKSPDVEKNKTSKADIMAALNTAFSYCEKAFDGMTDSNAGESVSFFNRKMAKIVVMEMNIEHTDEHYGNLVTYLRMKGLVPPSSQRH